MLLDRDSDEDDNMFDDAFYDDESDAGVETEAEIEDQAEVEDLIDYLV